MISSSRPSKPQPASSSHTPPNQSINRQLITGSVCKKTLGTSGGGLVHTTWIELGPDAARRLINNTQFTVNHWLLHYGMSIGIGDTVADDATMAKVGGRGGV